MTARGLILAASLLAAAACDAFGSGSADDTSPTPPVDASVVPADAAPDAAPPDADSLDAGNADVVTNGEVHKLVFVTQATYTGNDPQIDQRCMVESDAGAFVPWLSRSGNRNALQLLADGGVYHVPLTDGGLGAVFVTTDAIRSGAAPATGIATDAQGHAIFTGTPQYYWTGTNADGGTSGQTCADWTNGNPAALGSVGQVGSAPLWTHAFDTPCNASQHLLCFEK